MEARRPYDIDTITDIAMRVFAERGFDGATMDDVARAAGVTKAALYHHVTGKEALLERGLSRALDALFAILDEPSAMRGAAVDRVRHIVRRVAGLTFELLHEVTVLFRARAVSDVTTRAVERRRQFDHYVGQLIADAQRQGDITAALDPALAARLIFGMTNSVAEWYRPGRTLAPEEIVLAAEALIFDGLRGGLA